jgi:DNA-directed RNA polymerase specialized sigma24 family protein
MTGVPLPARTTIEEVFAAQRNSLLRVAFLMCGSEHVAEDIVQTAFVTAQRRWDSIEDPAAYLKRAVVNLAADSHRRTFRERRALKALAGRLTALPEVDHTWFVLQDLPSIQRAVVVLRFYEDLPLVEIAELLDRPAATIRSDLRRALIRLRRTLP